VFGAPTMFVGNQMFFGNDRLDFDRKQFEMLSEQTTELTAEAAQDSGALA
jgi:2-hydroxychromene-2-carboxylate isomerase